MKDKPAQPLRAGKLPARLLEKFLRKYAPPRPDSGVVVGPSIGLDAAVIDFHGRYLVAKTDPVTFVSDDIGLYSIHVNANDIAVMGGVPRWFLATVLLPEAETTPKDAEAIFRQISNACSSIGVTLCGGHTEITPAVTRPLVVGQMLGEVAKRRLVTAAGARPGDALILTKGAAVEATSIIARTFGRRLVKTGKFSERFITRCRGFVKAPGISVLHDARLATGNARVHAMHDPTEGGLATGLYELAIASNCGIIVYRETINVYRETERLCRHFGLDPLGVIASGSLLAAVDPRDSSKLLKTFKKEGIEGAVIGRVVEKEEGVRIIRDGKLADLPLFRADELTRIL
ncbi:MAG: AIR synthase family protein [Thermodesulfobacteriota bacterium]